VPIDPSKTAVVLIEYQNDFTSEGGALHSAVEPVMGKTGMLDKTARLVAAARDAGVADSTAFVKGTRRSSRRAWPASVRRSTPRAVPDACP
jgi:nicotinamidase-related amidase